MAKGLEMSGKDDLIKNSSITDVKEYTVDGKSTDAAMRLAKKVEAEMEQIKSQGSLERLRLVRQVFDLNVPKRDSVATAPFKIEAKHEGQGLLEAIANERPLLWAAFQEVPDLKLMAYASVMKGFDANVLEMGSVVSVDAAGKVHVTSPDGSSTHTADLFPWDIADAAEKRIRELEGAAAAEPEPTPAPAPTPAAVEPAPLRPDGRTPIVDGLEGAPPLRAVAPDEAPAAQEPAPKPAPAEKAETTLERLTRVYSAQRISELSRAGMNELQLKYGVSINALDVSAQRSDDLTPGSESISYLVNLSFNLSRTTPKKIKSYNLSLDIPEIDADTTDEDISVFVRDSVQKRVDRFQKKVVDQLHDLSSTPFEYVKDGEKITVHKDHFVYKGETYRLFADGTYVDFNGVRNGENLILDMNTFSLNDRQFHTPQVEYYLSFLLKQLKDGKESQGYKFTVRPDEERILKLSYTISFKKMGLDEPLPTSAFSKNWERLGNGVFKYMESEYSFDGTKVTIDGKDYSLKVNGEIYSFQFINGNLTRTRDGEPNIIVNDLDMLRALRALSKGDFELIESYKNAELVDYVPVPEEAPAAPEAPEVDAATRAEYDRVSTEMTRLATQNHWKGVNALYNKLLKLEGVEVAYKQHDLGVQAAAQLGDIDEMRVRLNRLAVYEPDTARAQLERLDSIFRSVSFQPRVIRNVDSIKVAMTPFDPTQKAAIAWAAKAIENNDSSLKKGVSLPKGDYSLMRDGEVVGRFSVMDETVNVDTTILQAREDTPEVPVDTVDQKEEARKALEDQLNGDEVAKQIMADIYAEYVLIGDTAANDVRFKVSSRNGDRFKYTFKYMISKDGEETVYESDELRGNLKHLDEVQNFVKKRLLHDLTQNEMVVTRTEYTAPRVSDEAKAFVERIQDPSEHPSLDEYQKAIAAAETKLSQGAIARAALLAVVRDNGAGGIRFDQAQIFLDALNVECFATYNAKMRFHEAAGNTAEAIKYARAYIDGSEGTGLGSKNEEDLAYAKQILINNAVSN